MPTKMIPIDRIDIPPGNREQIDDAELTGLAETIKARGLIQAIVVRPIGFGAANSKNGRYQLVAGERRLRAASKNGMKEIEASIQELSDEEAAELRLIENTQRVPLSAWEEADQVLAMDPTLSLEEIGARLGRTPTWVAVRRAIGKLIEPLKALVREQDWPMGHLPLLARIPAEAQPTILEAIRDAQRSEWRTLDGGSFDGSNDGHPDVPSSRELEEFLTEYQRLLTGAKWKLDDAELLAESGACTTCPKRSGAQLLLFPELADEKADRCLDAGCWRAKTAALIAINVEKATVKGTAPILIGGHEPVTEEVQSALGPVKVENFMHYAEVKKSTPGAVPAVIVSGTDAGTIKYVKPTERDHRTDDAAERPVNQETGERAEPTMAERQEALLLKRKCRAGELWQAKLLVLKPPFANVVDPLLVYFGTWTKRANRLEEDWSEWPKWRKRYSGNADGWAQLCPVLVQRMARVGPAQTGESVWKEAVAQAKALDEGAALAECWQVAVAENPLTKILRDAGVKDHTAMPK